MVHGLANQLDEFRRGQRLHAERDTKALIFLFGVRQAAEDDHGNFIAPFTQAANEIGSVGSGHDVIGDDKCDVLPGGTQQDEGAFSRGGDGYVETGVPEDRLPYLQLNGIIVNEENLTQNLGASSSAEWWSEGS